MIKKNVNLKQGHLLSLGEECVTAMMSTQIMVGMRDTRALGKMPPNGERVVTNMGGYHPP